ncbi:MAG: DUF2357 domain-containing protein [Armatimonadota bacterium]|nr:DUF2357 domain-containing protein [Armatimonadota bacterium]
MLEDAAATPLPYFLKPLPTPVPEPFRTAFHPATHTLNEWETYWLRCAGADRLKVGSEWVQPVVEGLFQLQFRNQLGLARIQPYCADSPVGASVVVEVISPRFRGPKGHYQFYKALLDELFSFSARLPFSLNAPTARGVEGAASLPSPLFNFHFFRQQDKTLRSAFAAVRAQPHRTLTDQPLYVPLGEASDVDAEVILSLAGGAGEWTRLSGQLLGPRVGGFAPAQVLQRVPDETLDNPENRFVAHFLREMIAAAARLEGESWWPRIPIDQQRQVRDLAGFFAEISGTGPFRRLGPMQSLPVEGLLEREGYRPLLKLWNAFTTARQPLFGRMEAAMEVRDIALLYEIWVFFRLVEEIGSLEGLPTEGRELNLPLSDSSGLRWGAGATFGKAGALTYNVPFARDAGRFESYSVPLRPDFTWTVNGQAKVVLDAKFRLDRPSPGGNDDEAAALASDIHKMHAYRDALGVRAAVALYPGSVSLFYHRDGRLDHTVTIPRLLREEVEGVGMIGVRPGLDRIRTSQEPG